MSSPHAAEVVLTNAERAELEGWTRRRTSAAGLALRARIILAAADGGTDVELADQLELDRGTIRKWRNRFVEDRCDGLLDEPRPGRPRVVGDAQIEALITATLETTRATHWSTRSMAMQLGLSQSMVSRVWRSFGLAPTSRIRGNCLRIRCLNHPPGSHAPRGSVSRLVGRSRVGNSTGLRLRRVGLVRGGA
jgi:transposase